MKSWMRQIYEFDSRGIPFEELVSYIGNGGQDVEWTESEDFPQHMQEYRYGRVQRLIDNEHILLCNKMMTEKIDDKDFYRFIQFAVMHLEMKYICDEFGVSQGTVGRWIDGRSAPHMHTRPRIKRTIQKIIYTKYAPVAQRHESSSLVRRRL